MNTAQTVLVTGATGKVGRHVVDELLQRDVRVRALSRESSAAGLPESVEVVDGDLLDPSTYAAALRDIDALFLLWPFFSADGIPALLERIEHHPRRVVFLSALGARDEDGVPATFHGEIEQLIERAGLPWTFLRAGGFASNTLMWSDQIREDGVVRWPYGRAARSLIHERDIAAVAAHALTEHGHDGATHVLTGPQAVTQIDQVGAIGEAIGEQVLWEELSRADAREQLLAAWGEPSFVDHALDHWSRIVDEPERVTSTVHDVTGIPARTFHQWALDHADHFTDQAKGNSAGSTS